MKNKYSRLRLILLLYTSIIFVLLVSLGAVWTNNYIKERKNKKETSDFYQANLGYDIEDAAKKIDVGSMIFGEWDDTNKTCTFLGLTSFDSGSKFTLDIPEKVRVIKTGSNYSYPEPTGVDYTVTKFDSLQSAQLMSGKSYAPYGYDASTHNEVSSLFYYGSKLTALIIPDTVTTITPASLYGLASLEYLKTPFIGENKTSRNSLHSMFSLGYNNTGNSTYQYPYIANLEQGITGDPNYKNTQDGFQLVPQKVEWYDTVQTSNLYFWVPANLHDIVVTKQEAIGNRTFIGCKSLKSVELPNTLVRYDKGTASEEVTEHGYTFAECINLERVVLSDNMSTLPIGMFSNCQKLDNVIIPKNTQGIPKNFFGGCLRLKTVYMPTGITQIGSLAFSNCELLEKIQLFEATKDCVPENYVASDYDIALPAGLLKIENEAFASCHSIKDLVIPQGVISIGASAFNSMITLETLTIPFVGVSKEKGTDNTDSQYVLGYMFGTSSNAATYSTTQNGTTYYIPNSLTTVTVLAASQIRQGAFENLSKDTTIGVKTIEVNSTCQYIAPGSFAGTQTLVDLVLPFAGSGTNGSSNGRDGRLTSIFGGVEKGGLELQGVSEVQKYVPTSLKNIVITHQNEIYTNTFYGLKYIKSVEIYKDYTTQIDEQIFYQNDSLETVIIPFVGRNRGEFYERWWWWRDIQWRNTFGWIFSSSYHSGTYGCDTLRYYDSYRKWIPLTLKNITITDESNIGYYSFRNLSSVESLTIKQNRAINIAEGAAYNMNRLTTLSLPFLGSDANRNATSAGNYTVGWIFGTDEYTGSYGAYEYKTWQIPGTLKNVTIDALPAVTAHSFRGLKTLESVTLNEKINSVLDYAFYGCENLSKINYKTDTNFQNVGNYAFYGCKKINKILTVIPRYAYTENVNLNLGDYSFARTSISTIDFTKISRAGKYAFSGCLNITSVNVTDNADVGEGLFKDCSFLTDFTLAQGKAKPHMFENCISLVNANIVSATLSDYIIPAYIFAGCTNLIWGGVDTASQGLVISNQTQEIGAGAFKDCISIDSFLIPNKTTKIGEYALNGITKYESIVIPSTCTTIERNVFTENIGHGFKIWVYDQEDDWPTTWVDGWNCVNPVYVIPGIDDSMYEFAFSANLNGYVITGLKDDFIGKLTGKINLPQTHNAVDVVGIMQNVFFHEEISKVVVPKSYVYFGYATGSEANIFGNGRRVDVYFESTVAEAEENFKFVKVQNTDYVIDEAHSFITWYNSDEDNYCEQKFIDCGYVFYKDYWVYGSKTPEDAITPYARIDKLTFEIENTPLWYDNTRHEPAIEHVYLNAVIVENATITELNEGELDKSIFNYTYSDNIYAGSAKVEATLNNTKYNEYKQATKGQVLLSGSKVTRFTIKKSPIDVYYTESASDHVKEFEKEYDEYEWKVNASTWGNAELVGLPEGYTITGQISTRSANAGTYNSLTGGIIWSDAYTIRYKGVDVTSNFEVRLHVRVTIKPKKVRIVWDNCEYDPIGQIYSYQYTGDYILPEAKVVDLNGRAVDACTVRAINIGSRAIFPGDAIYEGFAYLTRANGNYELESWNYEYNNEHGIYQQYKIVKRKLNITINDPNYLMGYNDDSYIFDKWSSPGRTVTITGLQDGSTMAGRIITIANGLSAANLEGEVYTTEAGRIVFEERMFDLRDYYTGSGIPQDYDGTITPTLPYLIYRNENNGDVRVENDYYDVTLSGNVTINYNKFDISFGMDLDTPEQEMLTLTPKSTPNEFYTEYEVDGLDHYLGVVVNNSGLSASDSTITVEYRYYDENLGITYSGPNPPNIKRVGVDYEIYTTVVRKNFTAFFNHITIRTIKSNIRYNELVLNKEYDGKPVSLLDDDGNNIFITKQAKEWDAVNNKWNYLQTFTYTWLIKDTNGDYTPIGTDPGKGPVEPGTYYLHLTATETEYFNAFDKKIPFTIGKRVLYIYVDKVDPFDNASSSATNLTYTGNPYVKTINTSVSGSRGRLLGMENDPDYGFSDTRHIFVGTFQTRSQYPQTFKSSEPNDFVWVSPWQVYTTDGTYGGNVTRFYTIKFVNDFDIIPKVIDYEVSEPYDGFYDGVDHTIDITVHDPDSPSLYRIYYSLDEANATNDESAPWSLNKPKFVVPGTYTIWFKIEAGRIPGANEESQYQFYYYKVFGQRTITIRELSFEIKDPTELIKDDSENPVTEYYINYDAHKHGLEVEVLNNPFAIVRYTLIYKPEVSGEFQTICANTTEVPYATRIGYYTLTVEVTGANFTTLTKTYTFRITEENLEDLEHVTALPVNEEYDGLEHFINVQVGDIDQIRYRIAYSIDNSDNYSYTLPKFTDCCEHVIYYRVEPIFDASEAHNYKIFEGSAKIIIYESTMTGITVEDYNAEYDGAYHGIKVHGIDENPLYTGATIYYTTNYDATHLPVTSSAWSTTCPTFKDVTSSQTIYIRIVLKNYSDFATSGSVTITKLLNPTATYQDLTEIDFADIDISNYSYMKITATNVVDKYFDATRTVQYSKASMAFSSLNIKTSHDGNMIIKYYNAIKSAQGIYTYTEDDLLLDPPMSLGTYYFVVEYKETLNCARMVVEGGFDLVPRVLRINYTKEVEYDGNEHGPEPTVNSGTTDKLYIIATRVDGVVEVPKEIGDYEYDFKFSENQVNYVIHPDDRRITFSIIKRKLLVKFEETKNFEVDSPWSREDGWTVANGYSFANKLLNGHVFHATMYTSSYAKATYVYSTLSEEASIYDVKVKDVYITDADGNDVTHLYDISYDIIVHIVYPRLNYQVKPYDDFYDGERHTIEFVLSDSDRDKVTIKYLGEDNLYHETPVSFIECGTYVVKYWIDSDVYQDVFGQATVNIKQTRLEFDVTETETTYDDYDKFAHYEATNVVGLVPSADHVYYFKKTDVTYEQLDTLFADFNEENPLYKSVYEKFALNAMHNAGEYYIVIHYAEANNWYESFKIVDGLVKQKPIYFTLAANRTPYITNYNENGFKYDELYHTIALGDATFNITDLVPNHQMRLSTQIGTSTTYRAASIYSVRTVSPNAGSYYGTHYIDSNGQIYDTYGFEFDRMLIVDAKKNDVTANYCPVFSDSQLQVVINRIPLTKFDVSDTTYEYNGLNAMPIIDTPSDGELTFTYYEIVDGTPYLVDEAKNVGKYLVKVRISAGLNFEAWPFEEEAYVTILPKEVDVIWENTTVNFNGDYQKPIAYFYNMYDQRIDLVTTVYYGGDFHEDGAIFANLYEAYVQGSLFTDSNYHLNNVNTIFSIKKISFNITVSGDTVVSDAVWRMAFDENLEELQEQNFPEALHITDATGQIQAQIMTIDSDGGYYQGNSKFTFNIKVTNIYGDDVTNSVSFNILGKVYINAHVIKFNLKDDADNDTIVHVEYDPAKDYSIEDYIQITNPTASLVTIKYNQDGSDVYDTPVPTYKHAGEYHVNFQLTASGYDTTFGEITLIIDQRTPYINWKDIAFNRPYDGTPTTREMVLAQIEKFECNGTPSFDDLDVTFYMLGTSVPLLNAPVNAGQYEVVIRCNKDGVEGVRQDYKTVDPLYDIVFEISRVVGSVSFTLEKEIDVTELEWISSSETISFVNGTRDAVTGVRTADPNQYDQTAKKVKITNYHESGFSSDVLIFNLKLFADSLWRGSHYLIDTLVPTVSYTDGSYSIVTDNLVVENKDTEPAEGVFTWNVFSTSLREEADATVYRDMTSNYTLSVNVEVIVHLPEADIKIEDVAVSYDGSYHSGIIDWANSTPSSIPLGYATYFAENPTELRVLVEGKQSNTIGDVQRKNPGITTVYYYIDLGEYYEPFSSTYNIKIEKLERNYNFWLDNKEYDDEYAGTYNYNSKYYLPEYEDHTNYILSDVTDIKDRIIVKYQKQGTTLLKTEVKDAGTYTVFVTIPETENFKETIITPFQFTIRKRMMYLSGSYSTGYTGSNIYYNNFSASNSYFRLYVIDGGAAVDITTSEIYISSTTIYTTGTTFNTYSGANEEIKFLVSNNRSYSIFKRTSPTMIENVTGNYELSLAGNETYLISPAKITITRGTFSYNVNGTSQVYTGTRLSPYITVLVPLNSNNTIIEYSTDKDDPTSWTTNRIGYIESGSDYVIYGRIRDRYENFDEEIVTINFEILPKQTELVFNVPDKEYDGKEVLLPNEIQTNLPELKANQIISEAYASEHYTYQKWDTLYGDWQDCDSTQRPMNAGKYRLIIEVVQEDNDNYTGGTFMDEFEIRKVQTFIQWTPEPATFVYNDQTQKPQAVLASIKNNEEFIYYYDDVVQIVDGDVTSKDVGVYELTVRLEYKGSRGIYDSVKDNYDIAESTYTIRYMITQRPVTITINRSVKYDAGNTFTFNFNEKNAGGALIGYTATGLVRANDDPTDPKSHTLEGSQLKTKRGTVGPYTSPTEDFEWLSGAGNKYAIVYNDHSDDVTKNYKVTLELYVLIDNSAIELTTSSQDYVYDGQKHFVDVRVTNLASGFVYAFYMNPTAPVINDDTTTPPYNLEELGYSYSTYDPDALNIGWKDVGVYYVYVKVSHPGGEYGDPVYRRLKFEITRKDLNLRLEDPFQVLDRDYDGKPFDNPVMTYADKNINPLELEYRYYEAEKVDGQYQYIDGKLVYRSEALSQRPFHAGRYKLIVSVKDTAANKNYTNPEVSYEFEIKPRDLWISFKNGLPRSKDYNLQQWQINVLNSEIEVAGLCDSFDVIQSGTIKTKSANAGHYSINADFDISNLKIRHQIYSQYTQQDYVVKVLFDVVIEEASINYKAEDVETDYDGLFHSISLKVFDPSTGYKIEYSLDGGNTWVDSKDFNGCKDVSPYLIDFRISADNYATVEDQKTLKINGKPANLDVQLPNPYEYNGVQYPGPTINTASRGTQTIEYYTIDGSPLTTAPTNVGHYKVRIHIAAFEGFDENETIREFSITEKEVELTFDNLEFTYDGDFHAPLTATYTNVFNQTVTVNIDFEDFKAIDAGEHPVIAHLSDTNYKATNPQVKFVIHKKPIDVPDIDQNMSFKYRFTGTYKDADNEEHEFEYGDKIVIKDSTGQYEYELDEQGYITGIYDTVTKEWNRDTEDIPYYFIIDPNMNAGTRTLKIRIKSILQANYEWNVEDNSLRDKDVEIEYTIEKYTLSTKSDGSPVLLVLSLCDLNDVNTPADYYQIYNDGEEIRLGVRAELKNNEGYIIKTLKLTAINPELPEYKIIGYENNAEISTPANKALIFVAGLNNFDFTEVVKFEITTQPPDTLQLKADSTVEFVRFEYISLTVVVEETAVIERTIPYQEHIFLGRVHQDQNSKAYIVSQFANENVKIFKPAADGTYPAENEITDDAEPIGTNYLVVLYDSNNVEIDSIKVILYGDIDCDGYISAIDIAQHININKGERTIDDGEEAFYAALTDRNELQPSAITLVAIIKYLQYTSDPTCDFNNNFLTKR